MNSHTPTPEPGREPVAPEGGSGQDAQQAPGQPAGAQAPLQQDRPQQDRPQYGLRAADLGLPSPYEKYQRDQEAEARAAQQGGWQGHAQQQPGPYAPHQGPYAPQPGAQSWQTPVQPGPWYQGAPPEKPQEPRTIGWAFWLILSGCAFGLISSLQVFLGMDLDELFRRALEQAPASTRDILSRQSGDSLKGMVIASMVITLILTVALYLLVAIFVKKGHHWARVLGTVLAAISVTGFGSPSLLDLLSILCGVVAIVLCWLPDSGAFFARMKLYRDFQKFARFRAPL
ncbi:hypothetical protein QFZ52_002551 [Arthrobacter woluwensis]|uniref:hypothetical protein n=1 Tax=Arthrobacter woluwensis TaxID=156980 RepID=UPI002787439C|nr:hypothetical protein [Arthrobacter woluwensis]MDQ0709899.1 hypothetical protein [Arthrobacter woluwensis]